MSAFEPISRAHAGFMNILHVGRTAGYLYYSMELADDHLAGRRIDIQTYEPRTLKTDLARHKRLSADESIRVGLSLSEALEALHKRGLSHRDIAALERGERPRKSRAKTLVAAVALLVLAIAGIGFWLSRSQPGADLHLQTTIRTEPAGALVVLGDHAQKSPATFADLEPRKYNLRIMAAGYEPVETSVDFRRKHSLDLPPFRLVRSKGALQIQSEPPGAQFWIKSEDGRISREGVTPQAIGDLPTGKYSIVARRGDWEMPDQVEVERTKTTSKSFAFVSAITNITSEPSAAEVFVDGKSRGRTPLRLDLPARAHELVAHLDGWPDEQQKIDVSAQRENAAGFVLANGSGKITSEPGGATVTANRKELGQTPLVIEEVKPGDVTYELRLSGHKPGSVSGKVEPQQQTFLAARLEKSVGPAPGQPFTNSLGMKFVPLGNIQISVWETRVQDYEAFCRATGRHFEPADFPQTATDPAVKVSWFDAMAFCKWLTEKEHDENLIEDRQAYRLPTDLEWSMAVGLVNESGATPEMRDGKIKNEFPWGKQWPLPNGAGNYGAATGRRRGATMPAGSFKPK